MLVDTGADDTCFPASFAALFGHSNTHPDVEVRNNAVQGIGGFSDSYIHSVRVSLLHPSKSTNKKPVIAWSSKFGKAQFIDKLDCAYGLIGMDIIREWREVKFQTAKSGILIKITI